MIKANKKSLLIGAGLTVASALVAGLAVAAVKHSDHHRDGYGTHGHAMMKLHKLDTNDDDAVSLTEFNAPHLERFGALDTDGDGMISSEEFLAKTNARFAKLDSDESGAIEMGEFPKRHKKGHKANRES